MARGGIKKKKEMASGQNNQAGTIKTDRWVAMGDRQIVNGSLTPIGDI